VLLAFIPVTALAITAQINLVVDKSMASALPEGSVSALYYADVVLGAFYMLGYSVGMALFPNLSRLAAVNDLENTRRTVVLSTRLLIYILMPLTLLIIGFATPAVGLIFGRGKFDAMAVQMTAQALGMYAVGLVATAALQLLQRVFYAFADSATPFVVGLVTAGIHIVLNLALMPVWAHAGIALSTSLTAIAAVVVLIVLLDRRVGSLDLGELTRFVLRCLVLSAAGAAPVIWAYANLVHSDGVVRYLLGAALAAVGGGLYFGLTLLTHTRESELVVGVAMRALKRGRP
jgi:putative peptidoglycan lipid II flippase